MTDCRELNITNGYVCYSGEKNYQTASVFCDGGYFLVGDSVLFCKLKSGWNDVLPSCLIKETSGLTSPLTPVPNQIYNTTVLTKKKEMSSASSTKNKRSTEHTTTLRNSVDDVTRTLQTSAATKIRMTSSLTSSPNESSYKDPDSQEGDGLLVVYIVVPIVFVGAVLSLIIFLRMRKCRSRKKQQEANTYYNEDGYINPIADSDIPRNDNPTIPDTLEDEISSNTYYNTGTAKTSQPYCNVSRTGNNELQDQNTKETYTDLKIDRDNENEYKTITLYSNEEQACYSKNRKNYENLR